MRAAGQKSHRKRWWLLSWLVATLLLGAELVFTRDRIAQDVEVLREAGRAGTAQPTVTEQLPTLVAPAAPSAGTVIAVSLRAVDTCDPGQTCQLRLQVLLRPLPTPQILAWSYQIINRCTGAAVWVPGGSIVLESNADRFDAVRAVPLPPEQALGVFAVTANPAVAASPTPLRAPVNGSCDPARPVPLPAAEGGG
ncbi:MAG: hypothetical protein JO100_17325 [Pseudonocardia sp.]|nr:hypothetical protein [Pseudonocardia sp.]